MRAVCNAAWTAGGDDAYSAIEQLLDVLPDYSKMLAEAGRDPKTLPVTVYGVKDDVETIRRYRDAGIHAVILALKAAKADEVLPVLDRFAETMRTTNR